MKQSPVGTYLRFLRKKSGLSQRQLARVLGTVTGDQISRHERSAAPPNLLTAMGYQVVFQQAVSEIFPGLYHAIESVIEERLREFEGELSNSTARGRAAIAVARQLEWLWERNNVELVRSDSQLDDCGPN
jgi:transcriptional regulator with XRE-family HTH domain